MRKRVVAALIVLSLTAAFLPLDSRAAVTPYFIGVNDTVLPFNDDTMPFISGGEFFVPSRVFEGVNVWAISAEDREIVSLFRGVSRYVDFYTATGITENQDGVILNWPPARRIGRRFYVPLRQVCEYFGLTYEIVEVPRSIIPDEQMWIIRIMSSGDYNFNNQTFVAMNERALRAGYNEYYAPQPPTPPPTPPVVPPSPGFSDVTIHLSFYDVSAGRVGRILDFLDTQAASGYHSCFFVSAGDIIGDPGLIRRIAGSGHTIGLWLEEGTYEEYLEASALLFEAAKVRTVLVSADAEAEGAPAMADEYGLLFWGNSNVIDGGGDLTLGAIIAEFSRESGARQSVMFPCSVAVEAILPSVYSFLVENEYTIARITETVEPIRQESEVGE